MAYPPPGPYSEKMTAFRRSFFLKSLVCHSTQEWHAFQFLRQGYFCLDSKDSSPEHLVFNRSVSLKDSFKK